MADYSGEVKIWETEFNPDTGPTYWWSHGYSAGTTVPKEYLSYLITLLEEFNRRQLHKGCPISKHKIVLKNGKYKLEGLSLSESNRNVEKRFGWDNPCDHKDRRWIEHKGYFFCMRCSEILCDHKKIVPSGENYEVQYWYCEACGKTIEKEAVDV